MEWQMILLVGVRRPEGDYELSYMPLGPRDTFAFVEPEKRLPTSTRPVFVNLKVTNWNLFGKVVVEGWVRFSVCFGRSRYFWGLLEQGACG